jgi:hypothetical protein
MMLPQSKVIQPSTRAAIDAWLAQNGARRFEAGASSELETIRHFLERRGYRLSFSKVSGYAVAQGDSRPRKLDRTGLFRFVDKIRAEEGLQPFNPGGVSR